MMASSSRMMQRPWSTAHVRPSGDATRSVCEYVVLSEFDIDSGSTVRHQYPTKIPGVKEDWLADSMLPEGAHNCEEDATYIFLNRNQRRLDEEFLIHPTLKSDPPSTSTTSTTPTSPSSTSSSSSGYFLYGFNLVRTRHDSTARRGAVVKALAVFSSYRFVDRLYRLIDRALEQYFASPSADILASLYTTLNACDLAGMPCPNLLEVGLMTRGIPTRPLSGGLGSGDRSSAAAAHVPAAWTHTLSFPPTAGAAPEEAVTVKVPLHRSLDDVGDASVSWLCRTFGDAVMRVYHAILTKKRVLFVGYNHRAQDVCRAVLSAAAMVAPVPNILHRTHPYATLTDLSFLETPGYLAGVTNPMFLERDAWWDLACVLDLANGHGTVYSPEEKKKSDFDLTQYRGAGGKSGAGGGGSGGGGGGGGSGGGPPRPPTHGHGGTLMGGLATAVGGRLMSYDSPEMAQQYHQDTFDARFVAASLAVLHAGVVFVAGGGDIHVDGEAVGAAGSPLPCPATAGSANEGSGNGTGTGDGDAGDGGVEAWLRQRFYDITAAVVHLSHDEGPWGEGRRLDPERLSERARKEVDALTARAAAVRCCPEYSLIPAHPWVWVPQAAADGTLQGAGEVVVLEIVPVASEGEAAAADGEGEGEGEGAGAEGVAKPPPPPSPSPSRASAPTSAPTSVSAPALDGAAVRVAIRRLQCEVAMHPHFEAPGVYALLAAAAEHSEHSCQALLSLLPESLGGLSPVAMGLLHPNPTVRGATGRVLRGVAMRPSTAVAVAALNPALLAALERQGAAADSGALAAAAATYDAWAALEYEAVDVAAMMGRSAGPDHQHTGAGRGALSPGSQGSPAGRTASSPEEAEMLAAGPGTGTGTGVDATDSLEELVSSAQSTVISVFSAVASELFAPPPAGAADGEGGEERRPGPGAIDLLP